MPPYCTGTSQAWLSVCEECDKFVELYLYGRAHLVFGSHLVFGTWRACLTASSGTYRPHAHLKGLSEAPTQRGACVWVPDEAVRYALQVPKTRWLAKNQMNPSIDVVC